MRQFRSIQKLDTGILYALELTASLSILLLAFGLIASMANVLTFGSVFTDHVWMQQVWAWTQCIAIDASVAGTIIRAFRYRSEGERFKMWLYVLLSGLLLFTAAIVSNIEAMQQTLNVALDQAYAHVFIPVEALIWIRSIAIVLLIVAHAIRHVSIETAPKPIATQIIEEEKPIERKEEIKKLPAPRRGRPSNNYDKVKEYLDGNPYAQPQDIALALSLSLPTVRKFVQQVKIK